MIDQFEAQTLFCRAWRASSEVICANPSFRMMATG